MTDGIRSRPPGNPLPTRPSGPAEGAKREAPAAPEPMAGKEASQVGGPAGKDVYVAGSASRPAGQVAKGAQAGAARNLGDVQFSNQDLAYLASVLAGIVKKNPKASRGARAKSFTRAILKGKGKFAKVLERMDEQEAEQMFDDIASMLNDSPRLAEWIDNVTEELQKY
jgi:hypothetical protein